MSYNLFHNRMAMATATALGLATAFSPQRAGALSTFNSSAAANPAGATNNWNSAANWTPEGMPNAADAVAVVPQGSIAFTLRLQTFAATVNSLTFQNEAEGELGITLNNGNGGSLTFAGISPQLINEAGPQTVDNTISAPITLASDLLITQNQAPAQSANQLVVSGGISGAGFGITKEGPGIVQLGGTNTYTGATIVNGGVLRLQTAGALPGGNLVGATSGSNLVINGGVVGITNGAVTFTRDLGTGPGQVQFTNSGGFAGYGSTHAVNLGGNSPTLVWDSTPHFLTAGQTLIIGSAASTAILDFQNPVDLNGDVRTINVTRGSGSYDGGLSGVFSNGGLTKTGDGFLRFTGFSPNTYTGLTTVLEGNLQPGKASGVTSIAGDVLIGSTESGRGILALQASEQIADTSTITLVGASGSAAEGLFRTNNNSETIGGLVSAIDEGAVESNSGTTAVLTIANSSPSTFGGVIRNRTGSNTSVLSIAKSGDGVLTLAGTLPNTYTGTTTVRSGTLRLQKSAGVDAIGGNVTIGDATGGSPDVLELGEHDQIANAAVVTFNGSGSDAGTLHLNGFNETVGGLFSAAGAGVIENGASTPATLTVLNSLPTSYRGVIQDGGSGSLAIVKSDVEPLTLGGASTYTGGTTVNDGPLVVNNATGSATGTGPVTVNSTGKLGGAGTISGTVSFIGGGTLAPGSSAGTLTLGATSLDASSILEYELGAPNVVGNGVNDLTVVNGSLILDGTIHVTALENFTAGTFRLFDVTGAITDNGLTIGTLPPNFAAVVSLADHQVNLIVSSTGGPHPGDFDGDGDVDGADFVAWQTNFPAATGATLAQGDADGDGDVDGADFVVWQTNFPFTPGPSASPIPEPSSYLITILGSTGLAWARRRFAVR